MSLDALDTLARLREFLHDDILPVVPESMRGEMRAALKVIDELGLEIDAAPGQLHADTAAMASLCTRALALAGNELSTCGSEIRSLHETVRQPAATLTEARARYDAASRYLTACIEAVQHVDDPATVKLIDDCYAELGRQAATRAQWQSVFRA